MRGSLLVIVLTRHTSQPAAGTRQRPSNRLRTDGSGAMAEAWSAALERARLGGSLSAPALGLAPQGQPCSRGSRRRAGGSGGSRADTGGGGAGLWPAGLTSPGPSAPSAFRRPQALRFPPEARSHLRSGRAGTSPRALRESASVLPLCPCNAPHSFGPALQRRTAQVFHHHPTPPPFIHSFVHSLNTRCSNSPRGRPGLCLQVPPPPAPRLGGGAGLCGLHLVIPRQRPRGTWPGRALGEYLLSE